MAPFVIGENILAGKERQSETRRSSHNLFFNYPWLVRKGTSGTARSSREVVRLQASFICRKTPSPSQVISL